MQILSFSTQTLGLLARVAPDYFSHTGLATLFLTHGIEEPPEAARVSKQKRVLGAINAVSSLSSEEATRVLKGMIEDLIPHFHDTDCMGEGSDPQVAAFVQSLSADGW